VCEAQPGRQMPLAGCVNLGAEHRAQEFEMARPARRCIFGQFLEYLTRADEFEVVEVAFDLLDERGSESVDGSGVQMARGAGARKSTTVRPRRSGRPYALNSLGCSVPREPATAFWADRLLPVEMGCWPLSQLPVRPRAPQWCGVPGPVRRPRCSKLASLRWV
jgi:hypothetical protein